MDEKNPFYRWEKPKNSLELMKQYIFEPILWIRFKVIFSKKVKLWLLATYFLFFFISYTSTKIIAILSIPSIPSIPEEEVSQEKLRQYNEKLRQYNEKLRQYNEKIIFYLKWQLISNNAHLLFLNLLCGLILGIIACHISILVGSLTDRMRWLITGFLSGEGILAEVLAGVLIGSLLTGVRALLSLETTGNITFGLAIGLLGMIGNTTFGLFMGLALGMIGNITFGLAFYLSYFRLLFYPFHVFYSFINNTLTRNAYLKDAFIWLPLPYLTQKLLEHSWNKPELAFQFADFLFRYRFLQRKLASKIVHTATAAIWYHHPLISEKLFFIIEGNPDEYSIYNMKSTLLIRSVKESMELFELTPTKQIDMIFKLSDNISKSIFQHKILLPPYEWLTLVYKAKRDLIAAEKHNHRGLKKEAWQIFHKTLQELEKSTLMQAGEWKHDYLKAIRRWLEESEKRLKSLELELQTLESVTRNKYRVGESLKPEEFGRETFLGREDSKNELSFRILASGIMPTFLLQGQRRVGKTSLLNFLPELLGSRFAVIVQDMQSSEFRSISDCLSGFVRRAGNLLKCQVSDTKLSDDPLTAWQEFEAFFKDSACREERKIILAFDEYENFHKLLKQEGETGERLLAAMRSFSQHQNHVVLLFTGLLLFSDLGKPDFSEYFVHALRLKVDYLKKEDSLKLITQPYPEFRLIYPDELAEEMYRLTVGHPALLQHICFEMVNRANILQKRNMNNEDLQAVLELVLDRQNMVMSNFWRQFCNGTLKETVREIMRGTTPQQKADVLRLLDYGFIITEGIENKEKSYKLRVPLFEQWIEKHGESFDYPTYSEP